MREASDVLRVTQDQAVGRRGAVDGLNPPQIRPCTLTTLSLRLFCKDKASNGMEGNEGPHRCGHSVHIPPLRSHA